MILLVKRQFREKMVRNLRDWKYFCKNLIDKETLVKDDIYLSLLDLPAGGHFHAVIVMSLNFDVCWTVSFSPYPDIPKDWIQILSKLYKNGLDWLISWSRSFKRT